MKNSEKIKKMTLTINAQVLKKVFEKAFGELKNKYDLTMNEILLLVYLEKSENKNTAKDIVEDAMVAKSHISKSVDSLVNKNLIKRVPDKENKKIIHLIINDDAKEIINELNKKEEDMIELALRGIPEENIKILEETLEKIKDNIKEIITF